jgi:hypothetical protein
LHLLKDEGGLGGKSKASILAPEGCGWSPSREEADSIVGESIVFFEPLKLVYQKHQIALQ